MSTAPAVAEALAALQTAGYAFTVDGELLHVRHTGEGTPDAATVPPLLAVLRADKPAALILLRECQRASAARKTALSLDPLQRLQRCLRKYSLPIWRSACRKCCSHRCNERCSTPVERCA